MRTDTKLMRAMTSIYNDAFSIHEGFRETHQTIHIISPFAPSSMSSNCGAVDETSSKKSKLDSFAECRRHCVMHPKYTSRSLLHISLHNTSLSHFIQNKKKLFPKNSVVLFFTEIKNF